MDPYKPEPEEAPPPPPVLPPVDPRFVPPPRALVGDPTLPPPPMAEEVVDEPSDVRLPWVGVPLLALASVLASGVLRVGLAHTYGMSMADVALSLGWALGYGILYAAILVAADRSIQTWSRPWRWAAGRVVAALLPLNALTLAARGVLSGSDIWWYLAIQVAWSAPSSAAVCFLLGWAAGRPRGLFLRLPALAVVLGLAVVFVRGIWQIGLSAHLPSLVTRSVGGWDLLANIAYSVLYGLALALSLDIARRRAGDGVT